MLKIISYSSNIKNQIYMAAVWIWENLQYIKIKTKAPKSTAYAVLCFNKTSGIGSL